MKHKILFYELPGNNVSKSRINQIKPQLNAYVNNTPTIPFKHVIYFNKIGLINLYLIKYAYLVISYITFTN